MKKPTDKNLILKSPFPSVKIATEPHYRVLLATLERHANADQTAFVSGATTRRRRPLLLLACRSIGCLQILAGHNHECVSYARVHSATLALAVTAAAMSGVLVTQGSSASASARASSNARIDGRSLILFCYLSLTFALHSATDATQSLLPSHSYCQPPIFLLTTTIKAAHAEHRAVRR